MAERLYLLKPGFQDGGAGPFFCADCALVEGMLSFFPRLREALDVHYIDYERPRPKLVTELGEAHQSAPVLVMDEVPEFLPAGVAVQESNGRHFIDDPNGIFLYFAHRYAVAMPHEPLPPIA